MIKQKTNETATGKAQKVARNFLGLLLITTGISHLTWARVEFRAQVPGWVPVSKDLTVVLSGIAELTLGGSLVFLPRQKIVVGCLVATFFVLIFPGNIAQFMDERDAFGLNTDLARGIRLFFQPVLVIWALWSTGAWLIRKHNKP
ncbi:MAG: hypothetical protein ABIQ31_10505 [Ferruginibacter sp.]